MISSRKGRSIFTGLALCALLTFACLLMFVSTGTARAEEAVPAETEAMAPDLSTGVEVVPSDEASVDIEEAAPGEAGKIPFPKPDTHRGDWLRYHGSFVELNLVQFDRPDTGCYACHARNDCLDCHTTRKPRDHTNFWRTRSHGLEADANRQRCLQCHRQDYCVRCHNETAPRTHVGRWTDRHCTWCHYSSGLSPADNCVVCHRVALHSTAPHAVNPASDCAVCHQ